MRSLKRLSLILFAMSMISTVAVHSAFAQNTITIKKFRAASPTDTASTIAREWFLTLKVDTGVIKEVNATELDTTGLDDGTYFACEADSDGWTHVGYRVDSEGAVLHTPPDTCIEVTVSSGESKTVSFYNFHQNTITVQKFRATSSTDTTSTIPRAWGLSLKSGSATGDVVATGDGSVLTVNNDSLADGTYYACEADSDGWTHVGYRVDAEGALLHTSPDTCVQVTVEDGQSRTVSFYNFHQNTITIMKFLSTTETDTSSTTGKTWRLKLKSGSESGDVVAEADDSTLTVNSDSLADGTYYACEADSGAGWLHIGHKLDDEAAELDADSCVAVEVSDGQSRTVRFWNFPGGTVTDLVVSPPCIQWSDTTRFTATITSPAQPDSTPTGTVNFYVKFEGALKDSVIGVPVVDGVADTLFIAINPNVGPVKTYNVCAFYFSDSPSFANSSDTTDTLRIKREDAIAYYTGPDVFAKKNSNSCDVILTFSATVKDTSAVPDSTDHYPGDIRRARVKFKITDPPGYDSVYANVGLVDPLDSLVGTATAVKTITLSGTDCPSGVTFTVVACVDSYYTNATGSYPLATALITVVVPGKENVSGGGFLVMSGASSAGKYKGEPGSKTNFGFTMKYTKSGKNIQGKANVIVRADNDSMYQIKSNAIKSMGVNGKRANFATKANVTNITDPFVPYSVDGNLTLIFEVFDSTKGGQADSVGITLQNNDGGLCYSSEWNGTRTVMRALRKLPLPGGGGNVNVMSTALASEQSDEGIALELEEEKFIPKEYELYQNYPNPFNPSSQIQFDLPEDSRVRLVIYDILGREVVTLVNGELGAGRYRQFWQGQDQKGKYVASGVYFYRIEASSLTSDKKLFALKKMLMMK